MNDEKLAVSPLRQTANNKLSPNRLTNKNPTNTVNKMKDVVASVSDTNIRPLATGLLPKEPLNNEKLEIDPFMPINNNKLMNTLVNETQTDTLNEMKDIVASVSDIIVRPLESDPLPKEQLNDEKLEVNSLNQTDDNKSMNTLVNENLTNAANDNKNIVEVANGTHISPVESDLNHREEENMDKIEVIPMMQQTDKFVANVMANARANITQATNITVDEEDDTRLGFGGGSSNNCRFCSSVFIHPTNFLPNNNS